MVYVDDMREMYGRMFMCHMIADTSEELLRMADKIGLRRKWVQFPGSYREHFDICLTKKQLALEAGAIQLTRYQLVAKIRAKK